MSIRSLKSIFGAEKKRIMVLAFFGPSGTGKSFRAKLVAQRYGLDTLIDDGLLIHNDEILAGKSAKLEKNYMGAVRTALFDDKEHRDSVARAIRKNRIRKILILGTSEKMVNKIAVRLQIPLPERYIRIEDIATPEQMEEARISRQIEGKHVIPVRAHEVKDRSYSKIFYAPLAVSPTKNKLLLKILSKFMRNPSPDTAPAQNTKIYEKSLVRPKFSQHERKEISHAVLARMTMGLIGDFSEYVRIKRLDVKNERFGYVLIMTVDLPYGEELRKISGELEEFITVMIEKKLRLRIEDVYIVIDRLVKTA